MRPSNNLSVVTKDGCWKDRAAQQDADSNVMAIKLRTQIKGESRRAQASKSSPLNTIVFSGSQPTISILKNAMVIG